MGTTISGNRDYEYKKKDEYEYNKSDSSSSASNPIEEGESYDSWKAEKEQQDGLRLTKTGKNEADFSTYFGALSDDVKTMLADSFDCEQDKELQAQIAAAFKSNNTNFLHRSDIAALCKQMGWTLEITSYATSYIPDYKGGNFSNSINHNGRIPIYTISDGKGGSIMLADANGNGGLEIEEVYGNELLSGVVSDIKPGDSEYVKGSGSAGGADGAAAEAGANNDKVTQAEFNETVESYMKRGYSQAVATAKASNDLSVNNKAYTGDGDIEVDKDVDQEQIQKETQAIYDGLYEEYVSRGVDAELAAMITQNQLDEEEMNYSGDVSSIQELDDNKLYNIQVDMTTWDEEDKTEVLEELYGEYGKSLASEYEKLNFTSTTDDDVIVERMGVDFGVEAEEPNFNELSSSQKEQLIKEFSKL